MTYSLVLLDIFFCPAHNRNSRKLACIYTKNNIGMYLEKKSPNRNCWLYCFGTLLVWHDIEIRPPLFLAPTIFHPPLSDCLSHRLTLLTRETRRTHWQCFCLTFRLFPLFTLLFPTIYQLNEPDSSLPPACTSLVVDCFLTTGQIQVKNYFCEE